MTLPNQKPQSEIKNKDIPLGKPALRVVPPQKGKVSDKGILYCVAYLVRKKGAWEARFEYCHGHDANAVKNEFCRALPRGFYLNRNVSITAIAPVVGYFVDDEKKMILSCD